MFCSLLKLLVMRLEGMLFLSGRQALLLTPPPFEVLQQLPPLAEASTGSFDHCLPLIAFGAQDIARAALVLKNRAQLPSRFGLLCCDSSDLVLLVQMCLACVDRYLARDADHFVVEASRLGD